MLDCSNHRSRSPVSRIVKARSWYVQDKTRIGRPVDKNIPSDGGSASLIFSRNMKNVKSLVFEHERHSF